MLSKLLILNQSPKVVELPLFQGTPGWRPALAAKIFRRQIARSVRLPERTDMQGDVAHERIPCGALVLIESKYMLEVLGSTRKGRT